MRNRIVDSTWLGRGRHVLLKQVLTCQTTSKRDPFSSTLLPLSRLFLAYSSIHTLARSSFHSLDRPLTRSLVHSHFVPPNRLFTYPHTRISGLSLARSFTPYSISPISSLSLSLYIYLSYFIYEPSRSRSLSFFARSKSLHTSLHPTCVRAAFVCVRTLAVWPILPPLRDREPAVPPLPRFAVPRRESQLGPPPRPTKLHE